MRDLFRSVMCRVKPHFRYIVRGNRKNLVVGERVTIEDGVIVEVGAVEGQGRIVIGDGCHIRSHAILSCHGGDISIGKNCSVQNFSVLYGFGGLRIGDWTRIATHTVVIPANHVFSDASIEIKKQGLTQRGVEIGRDVWIGANVTVLDGATIGDGAVVGAGSVVTKSIPPFMIAYGNPATPVRRRDGTAAA